MVEERLKKLLLPITNMVTKRDIYFQDGDFTLLKGDSFKLLKKIEPKSVNLIFADPPYSLHDLETLPDLVFSSDVLTEDGIFVLEHPKEFSFEEHPNFWQHRAYGKVNFTFFAKKLEE